MKQGKTQFDWNRMRAFVATADHGSLSAGAQALGLTQPTLGRQVSALEEELGVTLFERLGRSLQLTDAARELLPHARAMAESASHLSLIVEGQSQSVEGHISITASDIFSANLLPDILHELRNRAPRLRIDLVATNDLADLLRREADIAIRHVRPEQPDLFARLLTQAKASFYASPSYLERRGTPQSLADLNAHDFVAFGEPARMIEFLNGIGINLGEENFMVGSENGLVGWQLVRKGYGLAAMSDEVALATPDVVPVLPDMDPIEFPVWLVTHRELHTSKRIRLVFDFLAEKLTQIR